MSFKKDATKNQSDFFDASERQVGKNPKEGRGQDHWLTSSSAKTGKNFYSEEVFEAAKESRGNKTNTPEWFLDTLRSQHIPFNFFIPLDNDRLFAIKVLNELFNLKITKINCIKIEYPPHGLNPLKDRTSFDAFISYFENNKKGFIGIEVKYTEGGYSPTTKELDLVNDENSLYYQKTDSNLYYDVSSLKDNSYRQIWRNHILASEFKKQEKYDQFISATFYPAGNTHFTNAICMFQTFLTRNGRKTLTGITYEDFFETLLEYAETDKQRNWISYLITRYLVK